MVFVIVMVFIVGMVFIIVFMSSRPSKTFAGSIAWSLVTSSTTRVSRFIRALACEIADLTSKTHSALRKTWPARVASSVVKF